MPTDFFEFSSNSIEIDDDCRPPLRSGRAACLLATGLALRTLLLGLLELREFLVGLGAPDLLDSLGLGTQTRVLLLEGVGLIQAALMLKYNQRQVG